MSLNFIWNHLLSNGIYLIISSSRIAVKKKAQLGRGKRPPKVLPSPGLSVDRRSYIGIVKKTFRFQNVFWLQTLLPRARFREQFLTSGINSGGKSIPGRGGSVRRAQEKSVFMEALKGFQKKYLRGLAHGLRPVVIVGRQGVTDTLMQSVQQALKDHELIKIKFNEFKEKEQKAEILAKIEAATGCQTAGQIGHTAICFRRHPDPEKRKIQLPARSASPG
jgi:RNA-binding protein